MVSKMNEINEIMRLSKDKSNQQQIDEIVLQPYTYIQKTPGKQLPEKICHAFNHWLNTPADKFQLISEIVRMLHGSGLLLDDIEDNAQVRRGVPVAHSIYGLPTTVNAATCVALIGLEKINSLNHPDASKIYLEQLREMIRGQGTEIYWRDCFIFPSEVDYKLMAYRKTGGLFILFIKLMQLFSSNKSDFLRLGVILALYLQIWDDYSNLTMKDHIDKVNFCDDLTEGKFGFPVVHAIQYKSNKEVINILRQRTTDVEVKQYCIRVLEDIGSLQYTRDTLISLDKLAREEMARLGHNPLIEDLLNGLLVSIQEN